MKKMLSAVLLCSVVIFLLNGICCANNTDSLAFYQMIENNDIRSLQTAIDQGFDINRSYGKAYRWPLHEAVSQTQPDVVRLLIKNGADLDAKDGDEAGPIFLAVVIAIAPRMEPEIVVKKTNSISILESLIAGGANVNALDLTGDTPLTYAVVGMDCANALLVSRMLIEAGADPNLPEKTPPLFWLLEQSRQENEMGIGFQRADILKLLLDAGADPNYRLSDGTTPLDNAVFSQDAIKILSDAIAGKSIDK